MIHIYTAEMQPATNFVDRCGAAEIRDGYDQEELIIPICCYQRRPAKDCVIQCYYDHRDIWCAPDKGCNDPLVVAAKKAQGFTHRSSGQKARGAKL